VPLLPHLVDVFSVSPYIGSRHGWYLLTGLSTERSLSFYFRGYPYFPVLFSPTQSCHRGRICSFPFCAPPLSSTRFLPWLCWHGRASPLMFPSLFSSIDHIFFPGFPMTFPFFFLLSEDTTYIFPFFFFNPSLFYSRQSLFLFSRTLDQVSPLSVPPTCGFPYPPRQARLRGPPDQASGVGSNLVPAGSPPYILPYVEVMLCPVGRSSIFPSFSPPLRIPKRLYFLSILDCSPRWAHSLATKTFRTMPFLVFSSPLKAPYVRRTPSYGGFSLFSYPFHLFSQPPPPSEPLTCFYPNGLFKQYGCGYAPGDFHQDLLFSLNELATDTGLESPDSFPLCRSSAGWNPLPARGLTLCISLSFPTYSLPKLKTTPLATLHVLRHFGIASFL